MQRSKVFLSVPYDETSLWVIDAVREATAKSNLEMLRADEFQPGTPVRQAVYRAMESSSLLIADVSDANSNVMHDVGYAQAQGIPLILIASKSRAIPFDLSGIDVLVYQHSTKREFVDRLFHIVQRTQKNPEEFKLTEKSFERDKLPNLFISYSHCDGDYLDRLLIHLKPLEKEGLIDLWVDTRLRAGDRWKTEIENALNRATVAVLIVSADFLASDFITENELPPILLNAADKGTRIIPIIVKPCRFTRDKNLRHFQAINNPKEALILLPEGKQEYYYDALADEVEKALQRG